MVVGSDSPQQLPSQLVESRTGSNVGLLDTSVAQLCLPASVMGGHWDTRQAPLLITVTSQQRASHHISLTNQISPPDNQDWLYLVNTVNTTRLVC